MRERAAQAPPVVLLALVLVLPLHNLAMSLLYGAGVRGSALDVAAAWKDVLLVAGVVAAVAALRAPPEPMWADLLALAYAAVVVLYWILPEGWLGGAATARGELLAARHHLLPVGAYVLGRLTPLAVLHARRLALALLAVGGTLALWGLVDVFVVPLDNWRESGAPGWFREQLGLEYACLSGLPENWIFNTGDETNPLRRLTSTFLSPLATAYALVVVLLLLAARRRVDAVTVVVGGAAAVGLLYTHTRAAFIALAIGMLVLAALQRRSALVPVAAVWAGIAVAFVAAYPTIGPSTSYTEPELACLRELAAREGGQDGNALSPSDPSLESHGSSLRAGLETVLRHPQGYGLGNAGVTASRTGVEVKAGESTYTELGVDAGLAGAVAFVAWLVAILAATVRRHPWAAAVVVAYAALAVQTDVIGVHWLTVVVFALAGAALGDRSGPRVEEEV